MSEDETTALAEVPAEVETKVYEWTVLKQDGSDDLGLTWHEVGTISTKESYGVYGYGDVARLGGGAGEYLCIRSNQCYRLSIVEERTFRLAPDVIEEES